MAMFIMRSDHALLTSRATRPTVATFAWVAAGLLLRRGPTETVLAVVTVPAIAAMVDVRTSRWYIAPAGSGIIAMLASGSVTPLCPAMSIACFSATRSILRSRSPSVASIMC
jgi:hypothetical protein